MLSASAVFVLPAAQAVPAMGAMGNALVPRRRRSLLGFLVAEKIDQKPP
jgi:hypothetical protein